MLVGPHFGSCKSSVATPAPGARKLRTRGARDDFP